MAEWIGIGITAASLLIAIGTYIQWKKEMDERVKMIEASMQSPREREALAAVVKAELTAHDSLDTERFGNVRAQLEDVQAKLGVLITELTRKI